MLLVLLLFILAAKRFTAANAVQLKNCRECFSQLELQLHTAAIPTLPEGLRQLPNGALLCELLNDAFLSGRSLCRELKIIGRVLKKEEENAMAQQNLERVWLIRMAVIVVTLNAVRGFLGAWIWGDVPDFLCELAALLIILLTTREFQKGCGRGWMFGEEARYWWCSLLRGDVPAITELRRSWEELEAEEWQWGGSRQELKGEVLARWGLQQCQVVEEKLQKREEWMPLWEMGLGGLVTALLLAFPFMGELERVLGS